MQLRALYERFEFKMWLQDIARGDRDPSLAGAAGAADAGNVPAKMALPAAEPPPRVEYETVLTHEALERWLRAIEQAALVSLDTSTSTADPMTAEIVGISVAIEPARRMLHSVRPPICRRAFAARRAMRCCARLRRGSRIRSGAKLGQNLKYAQHALANHGIELRGCAHDTELESYVLESHKPHDLDSLARRHLDLPTIGYDTVTGRGARRISFDAGRARPRDRVRGRERRRDAAPASASVAADRARSESWRVIYDDDRAAGAGGAVPDGAQRRPRRLGGARRAKPRSGRARERARAARRTGSPARRSTSVRRSSSAKSCSSG